MIVVKNGLPDRLSRFGAIVLAVQDPDRRPRRRANPGNLDGCAGFN